MNKGGRPRSEQAQKLGRALTSTERSQRRRKRLKSEGKTTRGKKLPSKNTTR